jgi:hypothetical protein
MRSYLLWTRASFVTTAVVLAAACGGDDTGGMSNPVQAGTGFQAAGTMSVAGRSAAGAGGTGLAGSGIAGTGTSGRGFAGMTGVGGSGAAGTGAAGGAAGTGAAGSGGVAGMAAAGTGSAGMAAAGAGGAAGMQTAGASGSAGMMGTGMCCPSGDCLCHGDVPSALTSMIGKFKTATLRLSTGTVHYPTDAEPPFAAVAVCGGFLNTGPEMDTWGSFYASYGIVTIITTTGASDQPATRGDKLLGAIASLKAENMKSGSPLMGKLSGRYGTSGYSMGGGGTTIATGMDQTLKTSVGMAPYGGQSRNVKTATLLLCGSSDTTAPCSMASGVYRGIADPTPKMLVTLSGTSHLQWVGSYSAPGSGAAAKIALAFQKVFLEGDERWKPLLKMMPMGEQSTMSANID